MTEEGATNAPISLHGLLHFTEEMIKLFWLPEYDWLP